MTVDDNCVLCMNGLESHDHRSILHVLFLKRGLAIINGFKDHTTATIRTFHSSLMDQPTTPTKKRQDHPLQATPPSRHIYSMAGEKRKDLQGCVVFTSDNAVDRVMRDCLISFPTRTSIRHHSLRSILDVLRFQCNLYIFWF